MRCRLRSLTAALLLAAFAAPAAELPAFDPAAFARETLRDRVSNIEAGVPPQCYTRTGPASNPCYVCHTAANGRNAADDADLQSRYAFSAAGKTNRWRNLFVDRGPAIKRITDAEILAWVRQDNYRALPQTMAQLVDFPGWRPDLADLENFDADGFARDGSGWRAFRYKPFPGTFWPTNGSTDEAMVRLPFAFRSDALGRFSQAIYKANLAILEAAMGVSDTVPATRLKRRIEPVDERALDSDLDGDGRLGMARILNVLPSHYLGAAATEAVVRYDYPSGTEFLHPVRYLDPDAPELRASRLKELRYARKDQQLSERALRRRYDDEAREQETGGRPHYAGNPLTGLSNEFGWTYSAWIEDAQGRLRLQTREEHLYCMGCHSGIGVTVDGSFSLPRKLPGEAGWGVQRVTGQRDAMQAGTREPEYQRYLRRVGAGDEFRANTEMLTRFFAKGALDIAAVRRAVGGERGLMGLIAPSRERALRLDKAYLSLVREQNFRDGRDALPMPAINVFEQIENDDSALKASGKTWRDYRIWLDWDAPR